MAIGRTLLTSGTSTGASSVNTSSVSPPSNGLVLLEVIAHQSGTAPPTPSVSGNGLTWVLVASVTWPAGTGTVFVFRAMGASPSTGAITINFGTHISNGIGWSVVALTNVDTSGSNGSGAVRQSATSSGTGTSGTVTLAAFGSANNATYGAFGARGAFGAPSFSPGSGFTTNHSIGFEFGFAGGSEWRVDNDTSVDASWSYNESWAGVAIEIVHFVDDPPAAPTLTAPANGHSFVENETKQFTWTFNDPGDTQSAWALRRTTGGTNHWWRTSDSTWQTTEQWNSGSSGSYTFAANTWPVGSHSWTINTKDAAGQPGTYAATRSITVTSANTAPNAPTLVSPADGTVANRGSAIAFDWTFSDPDAGDTQSAWALKRVTGGSTFYWRVSDTSWQATEQWNSSATDGYTFPTESWPVGAHTWSVATKDAAGAPGPYSGTRNLTVVLRMTGTARYQRLAVD